MAKDRFPPLHKSLTGTMPVRRGSFLHDCNATGVFTGFTALTSTHSRHGSSVVPSGRLGREFDDPHNLFVFPGTVE